MTTYSSYTDAELLQLLHQGDQLAFTEIYNRYWLVAYRSAFQILKDEDACMDVLQDVFVWLWQNHHKVAIQALKAYLLTAVKFKMLNVIRQGRIKELIYSEIKVVEHELQNDIEVKELMQMIADFADTLPPQAKQIFQLSRYEHLSNKEIASKMGITEKTVKNQINISLKKLRSSLGKLSAFLMLI
jgi:RNA polymerase sigma-70 factor (family 1)